jgi:mannose-6-phosphate isomerase-like protein (cupin superfamily)
MTTQHKTMKLDDAEDMAPKYGMGDMGQARFLRTGLGAERIGMANYRMNPGARIGFGHRHAECEEMYVVLAGSGRFKLDDEIIDVAVRDVVYCPPSVMRAWEAGPDGLELLAVGQHAEGDGAIEQGWWTD